MSTPTPIPDYIETPKLGGIDVIDPDGKVTGTLTIRYVTSGSAYASTDDRPVCYRGHEFSISVHLRRDDDGTWQTESDPYVKYRSAEHSKPAPPTYLAVLLSAIVGTVTHHWSPEMDRKAAHAHAVQRLRTLAPKRDRVLAELATIEAERMTHLATVAVCETTARHDEHPPANEKE